LARGVLTGKYKPDADPLEGSRASRQDRRMMQTEWRKESLVMAQDVVAHAKKRGVTPGQFATAWVLANPMVTSPIAGPRTMDQWEDYVGALSFKFTKEDEALIDGMVASGHPSTPGYNDPAYPIEGRPTAFA
jgi:aryl-alcohol dehydrogenase-like predicted oxidoreductase